MKMMKYQKNIRWYHQKRKYNMDRLMVLKVHLEWELVRISVILLQLLRNLMFLMNKEISKNNNKYNTCNKNNNSKSNTNIIYNINNKINYK